MDQLRALSVRQPWAHAIVHCGKDVENRSRRLGHRGWTLIHASAADSEEEWKAALAFMRSQRVAPGMVYHPSRTREEMRHGGIVGIARIVDSVSASPSPWWMGPCGLVIDRAHQLPFVPCKGTVAPMFWRPDPEVLDALRPAVAALGLAL